MADNFQLKAIISAVDKVSPALKGINRAIRGTRKGLRDISFAGGQLLSKVGVSAAAMTGGIFFAVKKIVAVSAEFEKYRTILETIEGSSAKARSSMDWVQDFATRTPFELAEVTDAFVKLKAYGIEPQAGALVASGNAAAAMGKSVMQAVEAIADAMTGENERLKEFGIKASKSGDQIVYTWTENGKTMAAKARASSKEQIEAVITGIWNRRYGGAMDKLSGTWTGIWSNLMDQVTKFQKTIGDAGIFESLKGEMQGILKLIEQWEADGTLKKVAKEISDGLVETLREVVTWAKQVDWRGFMADLRGLVSGIRDLVVMAGGLKNVLIGLGVLVLAGPLVALLSLGGAVARLGLLFATLGVQAIAWLVPLNYGAIFGTLAGLIGKVAIAVRGLGIALLASPWGIAIAAVAALALIVYNNWDKIVGYVSGAWDRIKGVFEKDWFSGLLQGWLEVWQGFGNSIVGILKSLVPDFLMPDSLKNFQFEFASKRAAGETPLAAAGALPAAAGGRTNLQGDMTVRFENAPPGMRVEPGSTNQPGVGFNPDVGYRSAAYGAP